MIIWDLLGFMVFDCFFFGCSFFFVRPYYKDPVGLLWFGSSWFWMVGMFVVSTTNTFERLAKLSSLQFSLRELFE